LDVKVLLEADDRETIDAIGDVEFGEHVEVVLVPPADPRTKPKALNYGLSLARGELVTIYDVEDHPDPLQLRRAAVALGRLGPEVACLQAKLSYRNVGQNLITRWFTLEYAMWFSLLLPGLVSLRAPVPLGGTSNHFRRGILEDIGAWDPHNVTEDADLGIRFAREGFTVRILESETFEEANSDFVNWIKQRSRWYKGYLQTWIIHMRRPAELYRELGPMGFTQFNLFMGATPCLAILNPVFWALTIVWFVGHPHIVKAVFPAPVFYVGLLCWALGNFLIAYMTVITCRLIKRVELVWVALLVPGYWVMMSIAAAKALIQLVLAPTFWEKTVHGLDPTEQAGKPIPEGEQVSLPA
jgi:cellulose synthase/poly-beta-1,6-N-acetylglucosamine synthase-like glycosyltransferase